MRKFQIESKKLPAMRFACSPLLMRIVMLLWRFSFAVATTRILTAKNVEDPFADSDSGG
jgi:hypothetical protein